MLVGEPREELLRELDARDCHVACILLRPGSEDELRVFCASVETAGPAALASALASRTYDAVVFDRALELYDDPGQLLTDVAPHLREGGRVLAILLNARHGSLRVALIKGGAPPPAAATINGLAPERAERAFAEAGYAIEHVNYVRRPPFEHDGLSQEAGVPKAVLDAISAEPDADIYEFVVRAVPSPELSRSKPILVAIDPAEPTRESDSALAARALDAEDRAFDWQGELAIRHELMIALDEARQTADTLEQRVGELTRRRIAREETHAQALQRQAELQATIDRLLGDLADLQDREQKAEAAWFSVYEEFEEFRLRSEAQREELMRELNYNQTARDELAARVELIPQLESALEASRADARAIVARFEQWRERATSASDAAAKAAGANLAALRDELSETQRERDEALQLHRRAVDAADAERQRFSRLDAELLDVVRQRNDVHALYLGSERALSALRDRFAPVQAELTTSRAELTTARAELTTARAELVLALQRADRAEADLGELGRAQVAELTARCEELEASAAEMERRFVAQTEQLVGDLRSESAQIATLIDVVQSSHFWKLKRWLSRLLGRH